jgi:metal-responsive CopG/Arc/MetJ family transcriptional regulator
MTEKRRLSVSVDADLVEAGQAMVSAGAAASLSGWVNDALQRQVEQERRLRGIGEFIRAFETEHGEITEAEMSEVARDMRAQAIVVRGGSIRRRA